MSIFDKKYLLRGSPGYGGIAGLGAPALDLNFMSGALDPRISFSRADTTAAASYFDSSGVLRYGPTNRVFPSGDMTSVWIPAATTITAAAGIAPDGTNAMNRLADTATTAAHYLSKNSVVVPTTIYTFSIYAKAQQNQYLQLIYDDTSANGVFATFDLVAGTITGAATTRGTATNIGAAITPVGGGTYRCSVTCAHNSATSGRTVALMAQTGNPGFAATYVGNAANGLLLWGAQLEENTAAGPYVATTTAALSGPRFDYSPATVFNYVRNSTMQGAANGVLSAAPFMGTWGTSIGNGLTWSIVGSGTEGDIAYVDIAVSGTATALTGQYIIFDTTVNPTSGGQVWTGSAYFRLISGTAPGNHGIYVLDNVAGNQAVFTPSGAPLATQRASYAYTTQAGATTVGARYRYGPPDTVTAVSFTIRIGAPQLEAASSVGAFVPTSGAQAGAGGVLRGLLIEEGRTNLAFPSGDTSTLWTPIANITLAAASGIAPDGTNTMLRLVETAATGTHYAAKAFTVGASATYSFSLFAKAQQNNFLQLFYDDGTAVNGAYANFNLTTGVISQAVAPVGAGTATGASIQAVGNGVYRCSITGVAAASTTGRCGVVLAQVGNAGFATSYAGNTANGLLIWGAQFELSGDGIPTSYIPTVAASQTRTADFATLALSPPTSFSVAADWMVPVFCPPGNLQGTVVVDDGTGANRVAMRITSSSVQAAAVVSSATTANPGSTAMTANVVAKGAYVSNGAASTLSYAANGGAVVSASGAQPTGLTTLRIGQNSTSSGFLDGWLRRVRYWPQALTASQLAAVTK